MRSRLRLWIVALSLALLGASGLAFAEPPRSPPPPPASSSRGSFTENVPCSTCHVTTGWRAKNAAPGEGGFDHATTGFPLTGQHLRASCVSCHDGKRSLKRGCASCHADQHRGRLSQGCDTCHSSIGWRVTKPIEIHRMTRLPLTGMHTLLDCTECHRRANDHQFTGVPADCFSCHEKDYRRPGLRPTHVGSATEPAFPRDCSLCHRAISWVPGRFDAALLTTGRTAAALQVAPPNHDLRFPIAFGVHRGASCDDCHAAPASPRLVRCVGCHAHDPLRLAEQHRTPVSTTPSACLSCHPGGARR